MTSGVQIEHLLRWRLARSEAEAPRAPTASRLLELVRPWWDDVPDRLRSQVEQLFRMPVAYGYAMSAPGREHRGYPVPVLLAWAEDRETYARVLYLDVRDRTLRIRIELAATPDGDGGPGGGERTFEATFVGDASERPLLSGRARRAQNGEYRLEVELPEWLAEQWSGLKATDRMPFRLILRPPPDLA